MTSIKQDNKTYNFHTSRHLIFHGCLKCYLFYYVLIDLILFILVINIFDNNKVNLSFLHHKLVFQHQNIYTIIQQIRNGMGSLRHTFQLRLVAGRSHCRLCSWCLFGTYKLRPWQPPEPQHNRHIILHSRMFLSTR